VGERRARGRELLKFSNQDRKRKVGPHLEKKEDWMGEIDQKKGAGRLSE